MSFLDWTYLSSEFFLVNSILFLLWIGIYFKYKIVNVEQALLKTSLFTSILVLFTLLNAPANLASILGDVYNSSFLIFFLRLLTVVAFLIFSCSTLNLDLGLSRIGTTLEVIIIRLMILLAMLLIIVTNDLVYFLFSLELYSLSAYILIGYQGKTSVFSSEAAMKYFILGTSFSIIISYGLALIYLTTGLTNLTSLTAYVTLATGNYSFVNDFTILQLGALFLVVGILFKIAAAPFHTWSPDVYDGAPLTVMHFLSVIPKIALISFFFKLFFLIELPLITPVLILSAILSFFVGSLGGVFQKRTKRLLAYSAVSNNGFFLLALLVGNVYGTTVLLFFLVVYVFTLIGTFSSLQVIVLESNQDFEVSNIWSWTSLVFVRKLLAISLVILLFSSAGIPPFVGFMTKFVLLFTSMSSTSAWYSLILLALFLSSLTCFYYIRIAKIMSFVKKPIWAFYSRINGSTAYVISLMIFLMLLLFPSSGFLLNLVLVTTL